MISVYKVLAIEVSEGKGVAGDPVRRVIYFVEAEPSPFNADGNNRIIFRYDSWEQEGRREE